MLQQLRQRIRELADPLRAQISMRFFQTGPGQYGEGDLFLGLAVPTLRALAKEYRTLPLEDCLTLLCSPHHEERGLALIIMGGAYPKANEKAKKAIFRAYLANTNHINNWDLVDVSAPHIVGAHLWGRPRDVLRQLAQSPSLWERRIAIIATQFFIRRHDFADTLKVAELLVKDREDLIHKAVGWMLREVGNRDQDTEETFLRRHYRQMPRTMLRYAIEKFPESLRQQYLRGEVAIIQRKEE